MTESKYDPIPDMAELIDGIRELLLRGGDPGYLTELAIGPYAGLRGGLLRDEPGWEGVRTEEALREALRELNRVEAKVPDPRDPGRRSGQDATV